MKWVNKENTTVSTEFIFKPIYLSDVIKDIDDLDTSENGTFIPTRYLNEVSDIYSPAFIKTPIFMKKRSYFC